MGRIMTRAGMVDHLHTGAIVPQSTPQQKVGHPTEHVDVICALVAESWWLQAFGENQTGSCRQTAPFLTPTKNVREEPIQNNWNGSHGELDASGKG